MKKIITFILVLGLVHQGYSQISATVDNVQIYEHNYLGVGGVSVSGTFTNTGAVTMTSYVLNYAVNGGAAVTDAASTVSIPSLQPLNNYVSGTMFNPTTAGTYTIKVWLSNLNGTAALSDTGTVTVFFYTQAPGLVKNVLVEEFTGAWCGYCPGGALAIRDMLDSLPYTVGVAIHDNAGGGAFSDAMQIPAGDSVNNAINNYGFPGAMVDREYIFNAQAMIFGFYAYNTIPDGSQAASLAPFRYHQATPVNVSLSNKTYDSSTHNLTVTVNANYLNSLSQGDYRINLYVVEDSIITAGQGYDQHNYYSSAGDDYDSANSPLNALAPVMTNDGRPGDWAQNHVLRVMAGGAWGNSGVIPSAPVAGSTYSATYSVAIDPSWRTGFLSIIGVVQEYNDSISLRTVLNVVHSPLVGYPAGITETAGFTSISVYPNPASTMATVQMDIKQDALVNISVLNAIGQVAVAPTDILLNAGIHTVNLPVSNLASGLYFVKITANGEVSTLPLSVTAK